MRRGLAWALTLPLVLLGTEAAHALAYDVVYPQAHARILLQTGHGYLDWLPLALALAGAVALAALCVAAADAARGLPARDLPAWAFALLPPATFVIQELLELSLHTGRFGWHALLAPTFLPGLALQLPLAARRVRRGTSAPEDGGARRPGARAAANAPRSPPDPHRSRHDSVARARRCRRLQLARASPGPRRELMPF